MPSLVARRRPARSHTDEARLTPELQTYVDLNKGIYDAELTRLLGEAAHDPTRSAAVLDRLASQVRAARDAILYPDQSAPSPPVLDPAYQPQRGELNAECWGRLVSDAGAVARVLATAYDQGASEPHAARAQMQIWKVKQRVRAKRVVLALRVMLLARFYMTRATINQDIATEVVDNVFQRPQDVIRDFTAARRQYNRQITAWKLTRALLPGEREATDATEYNTWSRDFARARDAELGWGPFARAVSSELRYQCHKMELRQRWIEVLHPHPGFLALALTPVRFVLALALWIFKATTGFGLKPGRFALTAGATVFTFSALYFADDALVHCQGVQWTADSYWHEIYNAVANLTSVGVTPGPCGPATGALISVESLIGYFLLSVLAAMLFSWLTDR